CALHNGLAARQVFGAQLMDRYTSRGRSGPVSAPTTAVPAEASAAERSGRANQAAALLPPPGA
ncbi:MAG: hypothetical protein ACJ79E_02385, partial [Anaeromyxobacteraceae bacterium]